jgi:MEMO1 family protein
VKVLDSVRPAAVAGSFYPGSPLALADAVDGYLAAASSEGSRPKAIVAPHAGYIYSGPIAGSAFARWLAAGPEITRVVIVGPAHRAHVDGLATPGAGAMETPLGRVAIDAEALDQVPGVPANAAAHAREHSLEVMLPFLQRVAPRAKIAPFCVGDADAAEVAAVLEALWGGPETAIVVSSDLSHYLTYDVARELDASTAERIVALEPPPLDPDLACGARGIDGLVAVARRRGMRAELLDLRNSGDTAGDRARVVGYGAFAFHESEASDAAD